jgi:hypothetical protein
VQFEKGWNIIVPIRRRVRTANNQSSIGLPAAQDENSVFVSRDYQDFFIVEILSGIYKGQKPIRLVTIKINAIMPKIIAATLVILPFR